MTEESCESNPVLLMIESMRSVRDFKPDEVEERKLRTILHAAVMGPSSGNSQPWEFVVLRDREKKRLVGDAVSARWHSTMDARIPKMPSKSRRLYEGASRLVDHTSDVPIVVLACLDLDRASKSEEARYASIYPAVENLMLAAWSLGLACCLTTHACSPSRGEEEVKGILGMPKNIKIAAFIYVGYPGRKHGIPSRLGLERVVHYDGW